MNSNGKVGDGGAGLDNHPKILFCEFLGVGDEGEGETRFIRIAVHDIFKFKS